MSSSPTPAEPRPAPAVDVHQHCLTPGLADGLRSRKGRPPFLDGTTLYRLGGTPMVVDEAHVDIDVRTRTLHDDSCDRALLSLSCPLGIEYLPPDDAAPLLRRYHDDIATLPEEFGGWAAAVVSEVDADDLATQLARGCVGLQLPAGVFATPRDIERMGPLLDVLRRHDKPLLVHPGPVTAPDGPQPPWWTAVVPFVQQMHAAWHSWLAYGTSAHPCLRVCFVALAGLAPLHADRVRARGGGDATAPAGTFYETSSYRAPTIRLLGGHVGPESIVYGSDRPYAEPSTVELDPVELHAARRTQPDRLLTGDR